MHRLLPAFTLAFVLLGPSLALADIPPSRGGCNRCSVDESGGAGVAVLAIAGLFAASRLRRG